MNVCPDCFANNGLKRKIVSIRRAASTGPCRFHPSKKGVPIGAVAQIVDPVLRGLYRVASHDDTRSLDDGSPLAPVLGDLTQAEDDRIIEALAGALESANDREAFYGADRLYALQPDSSGEHLPNWQAFQRSLMFTSRFFNPDAEQVLNEIFRGVQQLRDADRRGPVYMIEPGMDDALIHRARIANAPEEAQRIRANPAQELGPPPEHLRKAGRLNPSGIQAFYGAFDLPTCIAELRPSVGGRVMSAQFALTRPICVLDTTRFANNPRGVNYFAPGALARARQWHFMKTFMAEIARPVFPGDEHLHYLPTQAVAEFLNRRFQISFAGAKRGIDAVIFRSAQRPEGRNIVILGDAAIVGMPGGAKPRVPEAGHGQDWLDQAAQQARAEKPAGLIALPETLRWTRITGAQFTSEEVLEDAPDTH